MQGNGRMAVVMAWVAGFLGVACSVTAQSVNLDFGAHYGPPGDGYGGAAGQVGVWQKYAGNELNPFALVDVGGNATGATFVLLEPIGSGVAESGLFSGFDENVYDDYLTWHGGLGRVRLRVRGLNVGHYEAYVYGLPPDDAGLRTTVVVYDPLFSLPMGGEVVGGVWSGVHEEGVSYTRQVQTVFNGRSLGITANAFTFGTLNALQLVRHDLSDFDLDGRTSVADIFAYLSRWFELFGGSWNGVGTSTDVNFDRRIDVADIFAFLTLWFEKVDL